MNYSNSIVISTRIYSIPIVRFELQNG